MSPPSPRRLRARAPRHVPAAHAQAISTVLSGSTWQRCRVHFMRNLLATVPQGAREAIAAIVRTIFAQPDHASALTQLPWGYARSEDRVTALKARFQIHLAKPIDPAELVATIVALVRRFTPDVPEDVSERL